MSFFSPRQAHPRVSPTESGLSGKTATCPYVELDIRALEVSQDGRLDGFQIHEIDLPVS